MGERSTEETQSEKSLSEEEQKPEVTKGGGLLGTLRTARQAATGSFDRLTGADFRHQFEEFTSVVTTTVLGVHADQSELSNRVGSLERRQCEEEAELTDRVEVLEQRLQEGVARARTSLVILLALIFSLLAILLGAFAVVRTL